MKNLSLLNDNTTFKLNDTGTIIQFKASNEDQPVGIKEGQSAVFRIRNEFGFLKSVNAHTNYDGYVFELDTSYLSDLVVGSYDIELVVTLNEDDVLIFPDEGFVKFNISKNALDITGEQLPVMSLDSFKAELKTYVDNETAELKSNFDTYVDNLTDSTVATATKASQDAQTAINTANNAKNTADTAKSTADSVNAKAEENTKTITAIQSSFNFFNNTMDLANMHNDNPNLDFNQLPKGIFKGNGWVNEVNGITNFPSNLVTNKGFMVVVLQCEFFVHQFLFTENMSIYHRELDNGSVRIDWKEIAYTS